jgi:hypothetical protein
MRCVRLEEMILSVLLAGGLMAVPVCAQPATSTGKPLLYGVVYGARGWVAYIEDPTTKTVAPYRVGDTVAGQTVDTIEDERVMLKGPDGTLELHLSDDKPGARRVPGTR